MSQSDKSRLSSSHDATQLTSNSDGDSDAEEVQNDTITLVVPDVEHLVEISSPQYIIAGIPWKLRVSKVTDSSTRTDYFAIHIYCNSESESTLWSCKAKITVELTHGLQPTKNIKSREIVEKFHLNHSHTGFKFAKMSTILSPLNGYVQDNAVTVEVQVAVLSTEGVWVRPHYDYDSSQTDCCDGIVVIDSKRIHVNKNYLAMFSPVFKEMFFGSPKPKQEIHLEDVKADEFINMLNVIYPSRESITTESLDGLLELGERYEIQYLLRKCEKFLIHTTDIQPSRKLYLSGLYNFSRLQSFCVQKLATLADVFKIQTSRIYSKFTDKTKVALLERIFKISQTA